MKFLSILVIALILAVWLFTAARQFFAALKERDWMGFMGVLAATFITIGALGFFGSALAAMGALNWLPKSFEWPVGFSKGVVSTMDHAFAVPHTPTGRIQIYDGDWKFVRGWNVDAGGGTFKLYVTDSNRIHVITARKQMHYAYDLEGRLISSERYSAKGESYSSFPQEGRGYSVPTPALLWVFSNPLYSWMAGAIGIALFVAKKKFREESLASPL